MNTIPGARPLVEATDVIRDGIETLPEPVELENQLVPPETTSSDDDLNEALIETFPASDPISSGRYE
jgi:hypothetical protein